MTSIAFVQQPQALTFTFDQVTHESYTEVRVEKNKSRAIIRKRTTSLIFLFYLFENVSLVI